MEYILVRTPEEGEPFLEQLKKAPVLAVDTETTGLDVHRDSLSTARAYRERLSV